MPKQIASPLPPMNGYDVSQQVDPARRICNVERLRNDLTTSMSTNDLAGDRKSSRTFQGDCDEAVFD